MVESLFNIGDQVETNEQYEKDITELNSILKTDSPSYKRGIITNIQLVNDKKVVNGFETDIIINQWICVTLDNDVDKQVNLIYLRKVVEDKALI